MRKNLTSIGSEIAVVLDPSLREAIKLRPDQPVDIEISGESLVIRPVRDPSPNPIREAWQQIVDHPQELGRVNTQSRSP